MAQNPDPLLPLTTLDGTTRTVDDWATVFNLAIVILPGRPEADAWVPVIDRMYATLGDSDARAVVCVEGTAGMARAILGDAADRCLVLCDPDGGLARSLGVERLPAFVRLRQDTSLVAVAEGWDPAEWQAVADGIARQAHWSSPRVAGPGSPPVGLSWPRSA